MRIAAFALLGALTFVAPGAFAQELMTDESMETVTARGIDGIQVEELAPGDFNFNFDGAQAGMIGLSALGSAKVLDAKTGGGLQLPDNAVGSNGVVMLSDDAQNNLNALVNVNSANSLVQVLLNLNVNINSTVGSVTQSNAAPLPIVP